MNTELLCVAFGVQTRLLFGSCYIIRPWVDTCAGASLCGFLDDLVPHSQSLMTFMLRGYRSLQMNATFPFSAGPHRTQAIEKPICTPEDATISVQYKIIKGVLDGHHSGGWRVQLPPPQPVPTWRLPPRRALFCPQPAHRHRLSSSFRLTAPVLSSWYYISRAGRRTRVPRPPMSRPASEPAHQAPVGS